MNKTIATKLPAIATSIVWTWLARAVNIVVSLLLVRILLTRLGVEGYGIWILVGSLIGYFQFLELGIGSATVRYIARNRSAADTGNLTGYFSVSCAFFTGVAIFTAMVSVLLTLLPPALFNIPAALHSSFRWLIFLCGMSIAISFSSAPFGALLRAHERFDRLNIVSIITQTVKFTAILLLLDRSLILLGIIQVAASCLALLLLAWSCASACGGIPFQLSAINRAMARNIVHFGFWTFFILIADLIRFKTDPIVISLFIGTGAIAVFHIGHRLIDLIREVLCQIGGPLLSRFSALADHDDANFTAMFMRASRITAFCAALSIGAAMGSGHVVIKLWTGDTFGAAPRAYGILLILALPAFLDIAQIVAISYFYASARHKTLAWITAGEAVFNIIISLMLVKPFGIVGVALGTALPMIITKGLIQPYCIHRFTGIPWSDYTKWCIAYPLLIVLPLVALQYLARLSLPAAPDAASLAVSGLILILLAPAAFYLYFPMSERLWILRYAREWMKELFSRCGPRK